ncbi:MAG: hypothetical protein ISR84_01850 [Kiritimatiellales bacterium]|nr:hypothetical protein [Kiritimatiellales bacterium]
MPPIEQKVAAELENIDNALRLIPDDILSLSALELAGLGAVLHSIYNGIENIIKQVLKEEMFEIPTGTFWHRDLLLLAVNAKIISPAVLERAKEYMAFRHFFTHAYALTLKPERMRPLVESAPDLIDEFKNDLKKHGIA